ncbi:MAG: HK97 gp10 family phage protein [Cupriavidus sp.]|nr:MAG: HK97 gp10 family phage protein [Cupriavidus sp.]
MPTVRGKSNVRSFIAGLPDEIERKLLMGAGRAAGKIVAEEARRLSLSQEVADNIVVRGKREPGRVEVRISVKGQWPNSVGNWLEWGTAPHFIRVDDSVREGRTARRLNELAKGEGSSHSLVINGKFVGDTVLHPGAQAHPFLRPALDHKERDAIAAAQSYINARVTPGGIGGSAEADDE